MNDIVWVIAGVGLSGILGLPLSLWAKRMGKIVYANSRIHGKLGKMFKEDDLPHILESKMLPKVQKSRYWQLMQFSKDRYEYEKALESLFSEEYRKIINLSQKALKGFLRTYYQLYNEIYDLKLILYCIENQRDKDELLKLLKTNRFKHFLKSSEVNDIISWVDFLSFSMYNRFGVLGLEYELDSYYYRKLKKVSKNKVLHRLYILLRTNYIIKQIIRLREYNIKDNSIIELLSLNRTETHLVKKDVNIILKDLSKKDPHLRSMIVSNQPTYRIFDHYFQNAIIKFTSQQRLRTAFSLIAPFHALEHLRREINICKSLWLIK